MTKTETTIKIVIALSSLAIGGYFQWQAKRLRRTLWHAPNSYALGRTYKLISKYENIAKFIYIAAVFIICVTFLY